MMACEKAIASEGLIDDPTTTPANNSSAVLCATLGKDTFVFTAHAGKEALAAARASSDIDGCCWLQIPHHGSIHNMTDGLVAAFSPSVAYVSAAGNEDHPHAAVIAALEMAGATVHSTHNRGNLWFHWGKCPPRSNYSTL